MTGISDDVKVLQAVFLEEASEILKEIERDLLELETSPDNRTLVDGLFRHLHTMKGSAGVAGMDELAHYTHAVESMLDEVRNGRIAMSSVLASLPLEALDCLKGFIAEALGEGPLDRRIVAESHRKILASMAKAPAVASARLSAMTVVAASPPVAGPPNSAIPEPAVASEENPFIIQVLARPDFFPRPSELETVSRSLEKLGKLITISHEQSLPSDDKRQGDTFYLWRSLHLVTKADRGAIAAALADWPALHRVTIDQVNVPPDSPADQARLDEAVDGVSQDVIGDMVAPLSATANDAELPPALPAESIPPHPGAASNRPDVQAIQKLSSIRVDIGKLDKLVNLVGGLITVEARLESFEDAIETRDPELAEQLLSILDDSSRILRELQDQAMNVRMVPIGGAFDSLHRMVRDYCKDTGKQVRLIVTGQDTEVDKKVSEQISAPLKPCVRRQRDDFRVRKSGCKRVANPRAPAGAIREAIAPYGRYNAASLPKVQSIKLTVSAHRGIADIPYA